MVLKIRKLAILIIVLSMLIPFTTTQAATPPDQPIGYAAVDLARSSNGDNMMGDFVDDAIYNQLNSDAVPNNDIDLFLNNPGSLGTDWCYIGGVWTSSGCANPPAMHDPALLNYGQMSAILPKGYATVVGTMTGAQILDVLNQSAMLPTGAIQPAGIKYKFYVYKDNIDCGLSWQPACPTTWAWGAYDVFIYDKTQHTYLPLNANTGYKVGTNAFLSPSGGDYYTGFKSMTNITSWGDMLTLVDAYVMATYGTALTAYRGPNSNGTLDGRIIREGTDSAGPIIPLTILHNNDSHGNLPRLVRMATVIKLERQHNPSRTLLLNAGDQIQGDSMMFYFRDAGGGYGGDGVLLPVAQQINPMVKVMNSLGYDATIPGNHEFNFGPQVWDDSFSKATFPILAANLSDDGRFGLATATGGQGVKPYLETSLSGIKIAILGITNHRVPIYEVPSNIPGLTFYNPITTSAAQVPGLRASNDVVLALTHIGNDYNPNSVDLDTNVDTYLASQVSGIDAIIGGHSHTFTLKGTAPYQYTAITGNPDGAPMVISQAGSGNAYLNEVILGLRSKAGGGYEVVSHVGKAYAISNSTTPEDATIKAIVDPYTTLLNVYTSKYIGYTTAPIIASGANTKETNGGSLQADASVFKWGQLGVTVDFHLSGPMTSSSIATGATPANPYHLTVANMFTAMGYENNLLVISMNGPQIKRVLERSYRNYYYYKYVSGSGGYENATTCFLDINSGGKITYNDVSGVGVPPNGNNVVSLTLNNGARKVDFTDASTYYKVSTANYLAAGSCNFNDNKVTIWPLSQTLTSNFLSIRDAVIDYVTAMGTISPAIEGRMQLMAPTIGTPQYVSGPTTYVKSTTPFTVTSSDLNGSTIASCTKAFDGGAPTPYTNGSNFFLPGVEGLHTYTISCLTSGGIPLSLTNSAVVDDAAPVLTVTAPAASAVYEHAGKLTLNLGSSDAGSGLHNCVGTLDGVTVVNGQVIDLYTLSLGTHTLVIICIDNLGNSVSRTMTFTVAATITSTIHGLVRFLNEGKITSALVYTKLFNYLRTAQTDQLFGNNTAANAQLNMFIAEVTAQSGHTITPYAANLLIIDATASKRP